MRSDQVADGGVREDLSIMGLPSKQARDGGKGQLLRQQAGPFLQPAGDDDPVMRREHNVAGDHVGLGGQVLADLTGQRQSAKAAGDRDGLVAVSMDGPRGEKTDWTCSQDVGSFGILMIHSC
jgi:hypothetical protein